MYRVFGVAVTCLWLTAMGALVVRDLVPNWTAQEPPRVVLTDRSAPQHSQCGIFDQRGRRMGTAWSVLKPVGDETRMENTVLLDGVPGLPPVRVEMTLNLLETGTVDEFELDVHGLHPLVIAIKGENYGRYMACLAEIGPFSRSFRLDASSARLISDGIRPFYSLPNLRVGQTWRMHMLDPLTAMMGQKARIIPIVVRVDRKERIEFEGRAIDCFVVVADRVQAWVDADGRVLVQRAEIPGLGRVEIRDELPQPDRRLEARRKVPSSGAQRMWYGPGRRRR